MYRLDGVTGEASTEAVEAQTDDEIVGRVAADMGTSVKCEIWRGNTVVKRLQAPSRDKS